MSNNLERNDNKETLPVWAELTMQVVRLGLIIVLSVYAVGAALYVIRHHEALANIEIQGLQAAHSVLISQATGGGTPIVAALNPVQIVVFWSFVILFLCILILLFWYLVGVSWVRRLVRKWSRVFTCPWTLSILDFAKCLLDGILVLVESFVWAALVVYTIVFIVKVNWPSLIFLLGLFFS